MADRIERRNPPAAVLALVLSLLALILSIIALLAAYNWFNPPPKVEVRAAEWDWSKRIARLQRHLARAEEGLKAGDRRTTETPSPEREIGLTLVELEGWSVRLDSRLRSDVDQLAAQAAAVGDALSSGTETALKRLEKLRSSVEALKDRIAEGEKPAPKKKAEPTK